MKRCLFDSGENSSGLTNILRTELSPWDIGWITFSYKLDPSLSINDKAVAIYLDGAYVKDEKVMICFR
jgi:hypothetical protein